MKLLKGTRLYEFIPEHNQKLTNNHKLLNEMIPDFNELNIDLIDYLKMMAVV